MIYSKTVEEALDFVREKFRRRYLEEDYEEFGRVREATGSERGLRELLKSKKKLPFYLEFLVRKSDEFENFGGIINRLEEEILAAKTYHAELSALLRRTPDATQLNVGDLEDVIAKALEKIRTFVPAYEGRLTEERSDEANIRSYFRLVNKQMLIKREMQGITSYFEKEGKDAKERYDDADRLIKEGIGAAKDFMEGEEVQEDVRGILYEFVNGIPPKNIMQTSREQQLAYKRKLALTQLGAVKTQKRRDLIDEERERLDAYLRENQVREVAPSFGTRQPTEDELSKLWKQRIVSFKTYKDLPHGWIEGEQDKHNKNWLTRRRFYKQELAEYNKAFELICLEPMQI